MSFRTWIRSLPRRLCILIGILVCAAGVILGFWFSPMVGLFVAAALGVVGASLHWPGLATCAVLFLLYSNLPAVSVAFHGVPKPVAALFPMLLLIPLVRELSVRRAALVLTPTFALLLLLLAVQIAGLARASDTPRAFEFTATFAIEGVLLYFLVTNVLHTKKSLVEATWSLVAAGALMAAVPLFQQVTGTFENTYGGLAQVDGAGFGTGQLSSEGGAEREQPRLAGTIGEKNRYAQVMLVLVPLALSLASLSRTRAVRMIALGCLAAIGLGFALAFSRGGAIGLVGMLCAMLALRMVSVRKAVIVAAGLALLLVSVPQYWKRLETLGSAVSLLGRESDETPAADGAIRRRITSMMGATRAFLDHPVVGLGPGMFLDYSQEYGNQDALRRLDTGRRAHNLYLELAAENGVIGLSVFLIAVAMTMHALISARRACVGVDPVLADLCAGFFLSLVCYLGTAMFLHLSYMRYFYLLLALCGAVAEVARRASRLGEPVLDTRRLPERCPV